MSYRYSLRQYRKWYARLLRLHSRPYHERFGEGMEQTFNDILRERAGRGKGLLGCALWMFVETAMEIFKENLVKNKNIIRMALATAFILLIPWVAMQFSDEVTWTLFDFVVAGAFLFGSGLAYELIARKAGGTAYRAAVGVAVAASLLLVWINLAVGIIGSEDNPVNLMYFGVLLVGIIGAASARLRPRGMARALFATACAQALVPVIALIIGRSQLRSMHEPPGVLGVLALNAFFVMLFVVSALLFRHSAHEGSARGAAYFRENGIPGIATILAAGTTGTTVNDMPQIELELEIEAPGRDRYTITDRRCWNPLSLAGLQKGAKLAVLVDPRYPKKIVFPGDERT